MHNLFHYVILLHMDEKKQIKYSIVIPAFNEEDAVQELHSELVQVMDKIDGSYEIIFVNDGSLDNTLQILKKLSPIKIISFRKNYGQTAAIDAGVKNAKGEYIIMLDADGQNPPFEIPKLVQKLHQGNYDVVSGWRKNRKDKPLKKFTSRGANRLRHFLIDDGINDSGCTLKIYKRECFDGVNLQGEMHRFIPAILKISGYKIGEVIVEHRLRTTGKTKYNMKRVLKGFIDMWSIWFWRKYAGRPLHLFGGLGVILMLGGGIMGIVLIILRVLSLISLQRTIWPIFSIFLFLVGIQLFVSGILADMMIKNHYSNGRTVYEIKDITERDKK